MLRQGPAADRSGRDDLHLRVHLLPRLRRHQPARRMSQLRRRLHPPPDPPARGPQQPSRVNGPLTRPRLRARRVTRAGVASPTPQSEMANQGPSVVDVRPPRVTLSFPRRATHRRRLSDPGRGAEHDLDDVLQLLSGGGPGRAGLTRQPRTARRISATCSRASDIA